MEEVDTVILEKEAEVAVKLETDMEVARIIPSTVRSVRTPICVINGWADVRIDPEYPVAVEINPVTFNPCKVPKLTIFG